MRRQKSVRRPIREFAFTLCVLAASALSAEPQGATFNARTAIVLTPTFFSSPLEWSLLESGQVYFEAFRTSTSQNGLYITGGPGGFQSIMETGDAAPELPGLTMVGPSGEWVGV
ncbi:MAG: hypothetical protein K8J08_02255, partial [Thermoanaerobaculia bacterium]|nr:hypothetical protein [Thermoanaerobaculia bacterium]